MTDSSLVLMVSALSALPFILGYWIARYVARRGQGAALSRPRPWQGPTLQRWVALGYLEPELADALPAELSASTVFYEWVAADSNAPGWWSFREPVTPETPLEALVTDAWARIPEAARPDSRERLAGAVRIAGAWWGGAETGWNHRPLALLGSALPRRARRPLPLLGMEDLTAAPERLPLRAELLADRADGPELVLALAALRHSQPRYLHPLAPRADSRTSMVTGLSTEVGSGVGRRIGAGLGAALGPIGSMVGQYLGEMAGRLGGKALAQQALPDAIGAALRETEAALAELGRLSGTDDFLRAAQQPADAILEVGQRVEAVRQERSRRFRERVWPTQGQALLEEVLRVALGELRLYREAADWFTAAARSGPAPVAGGMVLQNPWLVRRLPGGVERLNAARAALNRAAVALRSRPPG